MSRTSLLVIPLSLLLLLLLGACTIHVHRAPSAPPTNYVQRSYVTEVHQDLYHADWGVVSADAWVTTSTTKSVPWHDFRATGCTNLNPNVCAARGQ